MLEEVEYGSKLKHYIDMFIIIGSYYKTEDLWK